MKTALGKQMKELDNFAINSMGVDSLFLMENAARAVCESALGLLHKNRRAAVFCGSGNNGGDGAASAYMLLSAGVEVRAFLTGSRERMTRDTAEMEKRLIERGGVLEAFDPGNALQREFCMGCGVIIDAMFGIGLNTDIKGKSAEAVALINSSPAPVVAADICSGVDADSGRILGSAVRADVTVTFSMPKPGHYIEPGGLLCGKLKVAHIGIPAAAFERFSFQTETVNEARLPIRRRDAHKGDFGKILMLCGSEGYTGAAAFAAKAAIKSGAGLVYLGVPQSVYPIIAAKCDEAMSFPLPDDDAGRISLAAAPDIIRRLKSCNVCLAGPGLGRSSDLTALIAELIKNCTVPLVIDADGINALSENINILRTAECPVILTPHKGEFMRLGGKPDELGPLEAARSFSVSHKCILVLKGHRSITALPDGQTFINLSGNPGMAKGGSGDVLSGMIASLLGQGLSPEKAVYSAVWLHGRAGDLCAEKIGEYGMTPSDIISQIPMTLRQFQPARSL